MLGTACFRLSVLGKVTNTSTSALAQSSKSGHRIHPANILNLQCASAALPQAIHGSSVFARGKSNTFGAGKENISLKESHPFIKFKNNPSSCLLAAEGVVIATIWHALLPSRHLSSVVKERLSSAKNPGEAKVAETCWTQLEWTHVIGPASFGICQGYAEEGEPGVVGSLSALQCRLVGLNGKFPIIGGWQDGSWNVACDARPARWLHGRNSAWMLFGVCRPVASIKATEIASRSIDGVKLPEASSKGEDSKSPKVTNEGEPVPSHGKPIVKEYSVTGIPGDGRCLFRAVAHGACLRKGKPAPTESIQRKLADELRNKVVDELILRRSETEWFIEGDFDSYTEQMREPHTWGGEPELLMLSHVLKMPITVYMTEKNLKGLIAIAEYGQEYGKRRPICVLYHGFGHYEALQLPRDVCMEHPETAAAGVQLENTG